MNISSIGSSLNTLGLSSVNKVEDESTKSFQSMLNDAISEVNNEQVDGYKAMEGIASGKVTNLQEAVQKIEEAELSLKLALEVKNKALISLNNSYTFDLSANKLYCKNIIVKLSKKESEILDVLIQNLGEIISVDKFKEIVWDDITINDSSFRTVMKRLKDKIKDDDFIISHKGYGYIIEKVLSK